MKELTLRQIEKLGMHQGFLPSRHPFLMSANLLDSEGLLNVAETSFETSSADLAKAASDTSAFDSLYSAALLEAQKFWADSQRRRSVDKLTATMAALDKSVRTDQGLASTDSNMLMCHPLQATSA